MTLAEAAHDEQRAQIERDVKDFLRRGRKVQRVAPGVTGDPALSPANRQAGQWRYPLALGNGVPRAYKRREYKQAVWGEVVAKVRERLEPGESHTVVLRDFMRDIDPSINRRMRLDAIVNALRRGGIDARSLGKAGFGGGGTYVLRLEDG